jgi:hypothetical protein
MTISRVKVIILIKTINNNNISQFKLLLRTKIINTNITTLSK